MNETCQWGVDRTGINHKTINLPTTYSKVYTILLTPINAGAGMVATTYENGYVIGTTAQITLSSFCFGTSSLTTQAYLQGFYWCTIEY